MSDPRESGRAPRPSLETLISSVVTDLTRRKFDDSGFNPYLLDDATVRVIAGSGLGDEDLFKTVRQGTSLDPELVEVVIAESRDFKPDRWQYVAGGRLLVEETKIRRPEVVGIEAERTELAKRMFGPKQ